MRWDTCRPRAHQRRPTSPGTGRARQRKLRPGVLEPRQDNCSIGAASSPYLTAMSPCSTYFSFGALGRVCHGALSVGARARVRIPTRSAFVVEAAPRRRALKESPRAARPRGVPSRLSRRFRSALRPGRCWLPTWPASGPPRRMILSVDPCSPPTAAVPAPRTQTWLLRTSKSIPMVMVMAVALPRILLSLLLGLRAHTRAEFLEVPLAGGRLISSIQSPGCAEPREWRPPLFGDIDPSSQVAALDGPTSWCLSRNEASTNTLGKRSTSAPRLTSPGSQVTADDALASRTSVLTRSS